MEWFSPEWLFFPLAGIASGFLAGFFGIGGGLVIVPCLSYVFQILDYPPGDIIKYSIGTSLACIIITSLRATHTHYKKGNIELLKSMPFTLLCGAGSASGAILADFAPPVFLKFLFCFFAFSMAFTLFYTRKNETGNRIPKHFRLPAAFGIGNVSAMLGIAGGALSVPLLINSGTDVKKAIGISAMCGIPISLIGSIGFIVTGSDIVFHPPGAVGYVVVPAFLGITLTGFFMVKVGVYAALKIERSKLQLLFSLFLVTVGMKVLLF